MFRIVEATTPGRIAQAVELLRQFPPHQRRRYADHLHVVERYFNDAAYAHEMAELGTVYGRPGGCVLLALDGEEAVGAVCLRDMGAGSCEMKRLFVPELHRRKGIAKTLVHTLLAEARRRGHRVMRLDTGAFMVEAIALYEGFGFRRIPPYYPMAEVLARDFVFMEKDL